MAYHLDDTIVAIASPPGGAARGIVRLSGPGVADCVARIFYPHSVDSSLFTLHSSPFVVAGVLRLSRVHSPLPAELYLWHDGHSYTGQPVAEFHTLGSPPLLEGVLRAACDAGARLAEPGEFTLRAFLAGRIDLTQAEAVLGVIDASDARQLAVALGQLAGGLSRPLVTLRSLLVELLCHVEAGFEFPEEDLSLVTRDQLAEQLDEARRIAGELMDQLRSRDRAGDRVRVVLVGQPNAGKSTLFNALVGKDHAIVSHHPGTTRDYVSAEIDLDGISIELIDTAGVAASRDGKVVSDEGEADPTSDETIHHAACQVARQESQRADVRIHCVDRTQFDGWLGQSEAVAQNAWDCDVLVFTKADLCELPEGTPPALLVSSMTGRGLDALRARLTEVVRLPRSTPECAVASTAARCGQSIQETIDAIDRARGLVDDGGGEELVAAELRAALDAIGRVAGTTSADDVLDAVFSRFCVGK